MIVIAAMSALSCGVDPKKIRGHRLYADDRASVQANGPVSFAIVGNTRGAHPLMDKGRFVHEDVTSAIVGDMTAVTLTGGIAFCLLTGDLVRWSSTAEWGIFDEVFASLFDGETPATHRGARIPAVVVAGDRERERDPTYRGLDGSFPGTGASIGFGRVATWMAFDVASREVVWRFIVLDSGKQALGSRWNEQLSWIPTAVAGEYTGIIVLVHDPVVNLAGDQRQSEDTAELLAKIEEYTAMLMVKAVISAGPNASQAFLPEGGFGALHILAGGGGAPARDLHRRRPAANGAEPLALAPSFDKSLLGAFDKWSPPDPVPDKVIDRAKALGAFKGTVGIIDGPHLPTYGWWRATVDGPLMRMSWRMWQPDGTFVEPWAMVFTPKTGWTPAVD